MNSPLSAYKETSIKTASQGRLIVMLYEEAVRQLEDAARILDSGEKKYDVVNNAITKSQAIISELMSSLDMQAGGEIAANLMNLYVYFNQTLLEANVEKDSAKIKQTARFLEELRVAWSTIESRVTTERTVPRTAINMAGEMNPRTNYVSQLLNEEYLSLERYGSILSVFNCQLQKKGIETDTQQYEELLKREQLRIEKIQKVLRTFSHEYSDECKIIARDELIENCRIMLKRIVKSIDRNRCRLHDEIRSLNKNNSALGLRYNRYVTTGTEPGIIDITL